MKPEIHLPDRLADRLSSSRDEYLKVSNLILSITDLMTSHADFFPEYTEHGIPHVNAVLEQSDRLIPDATLNRLRPEDVCFLVSAVILHDLGMFLSVDGVRELLCGSWKTRCTRNLDGHSWADAWESYKSEVRRFSDEKMLAAFGELIDTCDVRTDIREMQRSDYLVIGEFLRRHHPRLAHEIAMFGFPGTENINLLPGGFSPLHRKLVGLIARSHGMTLRRTEAYVRELGNAKKPCGCPVFYLMAVLRIADLLDAGKHRAPEVKQKRQAVFIPLSQQEWTWNQKVDMANYAWDEDAALLTIVGEPESSTEFVRLKKWLEYIQQELDMCWAVISEKYGADFALSIHRVDSPILDPENETYRDQFLPREAKLQANPALLKHLVGPLYGDDPSYGVRELVQNAVDACLERENIEKKQGNTEYKGHVTVRVDTERGTFTIEDNGIGMNEDVLLNYYLSAGSSYRFSDSWAQDHAPEGTSQIARTGKFGVGFLAAFLLGDRVQVTTRHRDDEMGYQFEFDIRSRPLDVKRVHRGKIGTSIMIELSTHALSMLIGWTDYLISGNSAFNSPYKYLVHQSKAAPWYAWYIYDTPSVEYYIDEEQLHHHHVTLSRIPEKNPGWFQLDSDNFSPYLWNPNSSFGSSQFFCNGIWVDELPSSDLYSQGLNVICPHIALTDKNAMLDINLSRTQLRSIPEEEKLCIAVFRYHIARLLCTPMEDDVDYARNISQGFSLNPDSIVSNIPFIFSRTGFQLNCLAVITAMDIRRHLILYHDHHTISADVLQALSIGIPISFARNYREGNSDEPLFSHGHYYSSPSAFLDAFLRDNNTLFCSSNTQYSLSDNWEWCSIRNNAQLSVTKRSDSACSADTSQNQDLYVIAKHQSADAEPTLHTQFDVRHFPVAIEIRPDATAKYLGHSGQAESLFIRTFREVLTPAPDYLHQDLWIPFDMEERKTKFPKAFEALKPYLDYIAQNGTK